jgi:hypothetical protein
MVARLWSRRRGRRFGQPLGLAEVHLTSLVQPRHQVHASLGQAGQRDIIAKGPVAQANVPGHELVPRLAEQAQIVVAPAGHDHVEHGPAGQGKEHEELQHRKAAAGLLAAGLRVTLLVGLGVGQLGGGAVHHFDWPAVELAAGTGPAVGGLSGGGQRFFQACLGQPLPRLDIGGVAFVHPTATRQPEQGLDLAHDFAAGGVGFEHLPDEAIEGQPEAENPVAAVGSLVRGGQQRGGSRSCRCVWSWARVVWRTAAPVRRPQAASRERRAGKYGVRIERYLYRLIDSPARLFRMKRTLSQRENQYARLRAQLQDAGWISEGYVQDRGPGAGGPHYQWTRKVRGKTVSVALSREQFEWLQTAINNWRKIQATLKAMQRLSREVLFETVPHPPRRKRLGKNVLGPI